MGIWSVSRVAELIARSGLTESREAGNLASWLWEEIYGWPGIAERFLSDAEEHQMDEYIDRIKAGEPIQYIAGHAWFYGLKFKVNPHVLIPRPETEELVAWVYEDWKLSGKRFLRILDIGTGSGCIAITLKSLVGEKAEVDAIDISSDALDVARTNAASHLCEINFLQRDFLSEGYGGLNPYDVIISNPPYVALDETDKIVVHRLRFEPGLALYPAGPDPDIFYKKIMQADKSFLTETGHVYVEINEFRASDIEAIARQNDWVNPEVRNDLQGLPRMMKLRR